VDVLAASNPMGGHVSLKPTIVTAQTARLEPKRICLTDALEGFLAETSSPIEEIFD
jgi:hypothetical protein